jgi:hypothetical protein
MCPAVPHSVVGLCRGPVPTLPRTRQLQTKSLSECTRPQLTALCSPNPRRPHLPHVPGRHHSGVLCVTCTKLRPAILLSHGAHTNLRSPPCILSALPLPSSHPGNSRPSDLCFIHNRSPVPACLTMFSLSCTGLRSPSDLGEALRPTGPTPPPPVSRVTEHRRTPELL